MIATPTDLAHTFTPAEARERIGDREVIVSISGGKDSAASALHLMDLGIPFTAYMSDTGYEHADTYKHVDYLATKIGPIQMIRAEVPILPGYEAEIAEMEAMLDPVGASTGQARPSSMIRLCVWKGCFPGQDTRWCTSVLKVQTAALAFEHAEELVNVVGIRRGESLARAQSPEWETMREVKMTNFTGVRMSRKKGVPVDPDAPGRTINLDHVEQWRPLVDWSVADVVAIHQRHGLAMNPLYRLGAERVGCWPCIYARKSDIRLMADVDPVRIKVIERLEAVVGGRAKARREGRENRRVLAPPSWFQIRDKVSLARLLAEFPEMARDLAHGHKGARRKSTGEVKPGQQHACTPIGQVVEWSRTKRGGKTVELFAPPSRDWACSKYGYCETRPDEGDAPADDGETETET